MLWHFDKKIALFKYLKNRWTDFHLASLLLNLLLAHFSQSVNSSAMHYKMPSNTKSLKSVTIYLCHRYTCTRRKILRKIPSVSLSCIWYQPSWAHNQWQLSVLCSIFLASLRGVEQISGHVSLSSHCGVTYLKAVAPGGNCKFALDPFLPIIAFHFKCSAVHSRKLQIFLTIAQPGQGENPIK